MIAVVYSGSRYANWKLSDKGHVVSEFKTVGINPYFHDNKFITQLLNKQNELITNAEKIKKIYFFGAGASSVGRKEIVSGALSDFFRFSKVIVEHDLKAAAIATCANKSGIVGILGSGSNAAYYNGKKVIENNYGLGFILGDEGSANWIGRKLVNHYLTGVMPEALKERFANKYNLERKQILEKVYRSKQAVLFLSSFSEFVAENRQQEYIKNLVCSGFELYFEKYIMPLSKQYPNSALHFVGTVASSNKDWLIDMANKNHLEIKSIIREPINNVLNYYTTKNKY